MSGDVSMTEAPPTSAELTAEDGSADPEEDAIDPNKITILPGASSDGTAASFKILDEDHTLGNSLRYIIMKNPDVEFCGYSIPHPSEQHMHLRIQTYPETTAIEALRKGLSDLTDLCDHVEDVFRQRCSEGVNMEEPL